MQRIRQYLADERISVITVPFFKAMGYCVLGLEVVLWVMAYELLLFEIIPDLFQRNFLIDLCATTCGCGLLMGTVRSLYGAFKVKNYVEQNPEDSKAAIEAAKSKRYCKTCRIDKENIYSHCSICNRCVYEMDHHCFFLANCVGGNNYKFFLSYVVYAAFSSMIHFCFYIPYVTSLLNLKLQVFKKVGIIKLSICLMMSMMAMFFTVFLLGSHIYYMINNTSYLKNRFQKKQSFYDWKRFLFWYCRCGFGDKEVKLSFDKGYYHIFGSHSLLKILWPDFESKSEKSEKTEN